MLHLRLWLACIPLLGQVFVALKSKKVAFIFNKSCKVAIIFTESRKVA